MWCWRRLLRVPWTARRSNHSGKDPDAEKDWRQEKGTVEDEMVGWHHWLDGHDFEQVPGVMDREAWFAAVHRVSELDMTERLNSTEFKLSMSSSYQKSRIRLFSTPWTAAYQASLFFTVSQSLLKFISIVSVMPSNHLILCHPLLPLPSVFPSIRIFSNESALRIRWPKYWSFSFSISPSSEYAGLIFFRINQLDLLAVQGTLKSLFLRWTGMTQKDGMGKEVGGGFRMGNTCKSMADSCQCMAKTTTIL